MSVEVLRRRQEFPQQGGRDGGREGGSDDFREKDDNDRGATHVCDGKKIPQQSFTIVDAIFWLVSSIHAQFMPTKIFPKKLTSVFVVENKN